jgi:acetolactate synthase-1/2/3 large subunit
MNPLKSKQRQPMVPVTRVRPSRPVKVGGCPPRASLVVPAAPLSRPSEARTRRLKDDPHGLFGRLVENGVEDEGRTILSEFADDKAYATSAVEDASVAHAILDILEREGVRYIFGVPGGPLTCFFEALSERKSIRFILAKHESGASFMAAAYARVSRNLAVCIATSGPGATNALTGIASAHSESLPVLLLTGQVATRHFGKGAIQDSSVHGVDVVALFRPVTKLSVMLPHVARSPDVIRTAIRTALSGRRGPVHVSLPADMLSQHVRYHALEPSQYRATRAAPVDEQAVYEAVQLLRAAKAPCILAGHGVALSGASDALAELAHLLPARVATSPKGKGVFPENDPLSLGVLGFGGHDRAEQHLASGETDLLMIVGSSMNEFVTNGWTVRLNPQATVVQIDVDPESIGENYPVDLSIVGDARSALRRLIAGLPTSARGSSRRHGARSREFQSGGLAAVAPSHGDARPLKARELVLELRDAMSLDAMLFVDNGNSILWATHYFEVRRPDTYFIDLGLSAMGSAVAGVVGGAMAAPRRRAVALVGDAAFAMQGAEVHTAVDAGVPVVWVVLNNGGHGMVHRGETLLKGRDFGTSLFRVALDLAAMARAMGARAERVDTLRAFREVLERALAGSEPFVIDAVVDPAEMAPTLERRAQALARSFGSRSSTT